MSDIKCPVCNQPLHDDHDGFYSCYSDNCCVSGGTLDTWQELDRWKQSAEDHQNWLRLAEKRLERTRKALEIAVDALKIAKDCCSDYSIECLAGETLDKITALEQKDVK